MPVGAIAALGVLGGISAPIASTRDSTAAPEPVSADQLVVRNGTDDSTELPALNPTGDGQLDAYRDARSQMGLSADPETVRALMSDPEAHKGVDYGFPVTDAERELVRFQLDVQTALNLSVSKIAERLGERYAGVEIDQRRNARVTVYVTQLGEPAELVDLFPPATVIDEVEVPRSAIELARDKKAVMDAMMRREHHLGGREVIGGASVVKDGVQVIWLSGDADAAAVSDITDEVRSDQALDGIQVELRFGHDAPTKHVSRTDPPPYIEAGEFLANPGCSTAFNVRKDNGLDGWLTAGHCTQTLQQEWKYGSGAVGGYTKAYMQCAPAGVINHSDSAFVFSIQINDGKVWWTPSQPTRDVGPGWFNNVSPGSTAWASYGKTNGPFMLTAGSEERFDYWQASGCGGQEDHNQSFSTGNAGQAGDSGSPISIMFSDGRLGPAGVYWGIKQFRDGLSWNNKASSSMMQYVVANLGIATVYRHP